MFRDMRRSKQILSAEECVQILTRGTSGVLSLSGDDGFPYGVPMSYVYHDGKLYFHSAGSGHKLDAIAHNPKASFCVIDQDQIVEEECTTYFRSVILFGTVRVLEDEGDRRKALEQLAMRYAPGYPAVREQEFAKYFSQVCVLELDVAHMTGKEAIELVRAKQ